MSHLESTPSTTSNHVPEEKASKRGWRKFLERSRNWLAYKDKSEWLKDMRGNLSLVATVIATMTYQSAVNPPGGFVQANNTVSYCSHRNSSNPCPGHAVLAVVHPDYYASFLMFNTICFIASVSVCLLLLSGLPLNHRFPTWLLSIGMCITMMFFALSYFYGTAMVTPDGILPKIASNASAIVLMVWMGFVGIGSFLFVIRVVCLGVCKCMKICTVPAAPENNEKISIDHA